MNIHKLQQEADKLRNNGKTKPAIALYQKLFKLYDDEENFAKAGGQLQMIGVCYKIDNDTDKALRQLNKAKDYFTEHKIMVGVANALRDAGITLEYVDRLHEAESYLNQALKILDQQKNPAEFGITLAKLGLVQTRQKKYDEAEISLQKAIKILKKTNHWFFQATALMHLAALYLEEKEYQKALEVLEKTIEIYDREKQQEIHTRRYAQVWGMMANAYANFGDRKLAKEYYNKAIKIIETLNPTAAKIVLRDIRSQNTLQKISQSEL